MELKSGHVDGVGMFEVVRMVLSSISMALQYLCSCVTQRMVMHVWLVMNRSRRPSSTFATKLMVCFAWPKTSSMSDAPCR